MHYHQAQKSSLEKKNIAKGSQKVVLAVSSPGLYLNSEGKALGTTTCSLLYLKQDRTSLKWAAVSNNNVQLGKNILNILSIQYFRGSHSEIGFLFYYMYNQILKHLWYYTKPKFDM